MLSTVTKKYDTPVSVIQSTKDLSMLSALEMIGLFKAQEQRDKSRMNHRSSEKAFQANPKSNSKKFDEKYSSSNSGGNKGKYPPCRICTRTNHLEKDCR